MFMPLRCWKKVADSFNRRHKDAQWAKRISRRECRIEPLEKRELLAVNLISNGSFEYPEVTHASNWDIFATVSGWSQEAVVTSGATLEFQEGAIVAATHGDQYIELGADVNGHVGDDPVPEQGSMHIWQEVEDLQPGATYQLAFDFGARPNIPDDDNNLRVEVELDASTTISEDYALAADAGWNAYVIEFAALKSTATINFTDIGVNDSFGTFLDNVRLYRIPDRTKCGPCSREGSLSASGIGLLGQTAQASCSSSTDLSYNNLNLSDQGYGPGWSSSAAPYVTPVYDDTSAAIEKLAVVQGLNTMWFAEQSGAFVAEEDIYYSLSHDTGNHLYVLTGPDGTQQRFHDFTVDDVEGKLASAGQPGDTSVSYGYSGGKVDTITRSSKESSYVELATYAYLGDQVQSVTFSHWPGTGDPTPYRKDTYSYYSDSEYYGIEGDLKTITESVYVDAGWEDEGTRYFRYYTTDDADGFEHGLKQALDPEAFAKLDAATSGNPFGASDETISDYACWAYSYDSDRRVDELIRFGGSDTFDLDYDSHADEAGYAPGYNTWESRVVETRADGSTMTVYANFAGQVLLTNLHDTSGDDWVTYNQFDTEGRLLEVYNPSAVISYAESAGATSRGLSVSLRSQAGLVHVYAYYDSVAGQPDGYLRYEYVRQGETGDDVLLREYEYGENVVGSTTVHPLDTILVYETDVTTVDTSYDYTYYGSTHEVQEETVTLPVVGATELGSGDTVTRKSYFDEDGRLAWSMDELGRVDYYGYDDVTGALVQSIQDVDSEQLGGLTSPAAWTIPSDGQHLVTDYDVDIHGRTTEVLGPEHTVEGDAVRTATWTVYHDADHEVWTAQGYQTVATGLSTLVGPVSITRADRDGRVIDRINAIWSSTVAALLAADPSSAFSQSDYTSWTSHKYMKTRLAKTAVYYDIAGASGDSDTDGFVGAEGTHYDVTEYDYDSMGRPNYRRSPGGTITRTVYDTRDQAIATYIGTDDTDATDADPTGGSAAGNNMVLVSENEYDNGQDGGDGLLTSSTVHASATDTLVTDYGYTWRNEQEWSLQADGTYSMQYYDRLGRVYQTDRYLDTAEDGPSALDVLLGRSEVKYDDRGRVYESRVYEVDPDTGDLGHYLANYTWRDNAGRPIKSQSGDAGVFTKTVYNTLGGVETVYFAYDSDGETTAAVHGGSLDVADDYVIEQAEYTYDDVGQTIFVTSRARHHDAAIGATGKGPLEDSSTEPVARVTYSAMWYDGIGRQSASATWGTNSGSTPTRATTAPTVSTSSMLVTQMAYAWEDLAFDGDDNTLFVVTSTDAAGRVDRTIYDVAGRVVRTIQNYEDGVPEWDESDTDVTTLTTYTADGQVATYTAVNPLRGDVDFDGDVDADDIDAVFVAKAALSTDPLYDIDGDGGPTDQADVDALVRDVIGTEYGDLDLDGDVDFFDYTTVKAAYGMSNASWADGDTDGNTIVDFFDYTTVKGNFGFTTTLVPLSPYQTTTYVYGTTLTESEIARSDLLRATIYPDSDDPTDLSGNGTDSEFDRTETTYDRLGRSVTTTDQRGVVHEYTYDAAGRPTVDTVASLGSSGNVDNAVLRIGTTYDTLGRVQAVTSYSDAFGTQPANQVAYSYDDWGNLTEEWQAHDGAVNTATTPSVQYAYDDGAVGDVGKYNRLTKVVYPNGRSVGYDYGATGAIDDIMSRLSAIFDDTNDDGDIDAGEDVYASYKYLGAGRIVTEDYEDIDVKLDYSANNFASLDRFGRVLDQFWSDYGANPDPDHYGYTYDRAGNRTSKDNELHSAFDEDYLYDDLDRLTDADRADAFDQTWTLDGLGNFRVFDDDGTSQNRTTNEANEIQSISGSWVEPTYDAAGNMKFGPKPGDETTGQHYVYDAWNHLVAVYEDDGDGVFELGTGDTSVAQYKYDGANRRIEKVVTGTSDVHYYYNQQWQMLEEVYVDGQGATVASSEYIGSPRYVDAPVVRFHDANGDGDYLDAGDNVRYYTTDANFNVTATIDTTGSVVERYVYDAYGAATVYNPTWTTSSAPTTDGPLYCGYFFDAETFLYQVRNRYYDSSLSTFVSRDPLAADINLYRYCASNPLLYIDPTGEDWLDCMAACIEDNDPVNLVLEAAIAQLSVGLWPKEMFAKMAAAMGDTELAHAIRVSKGTMGQELTNMPKGLLKLLRSKPSAGLNSVLKIGGKTLGRLNIAYGLYLAAAEVHCMGYCCTASILGISYSPQDGRMKKSIEDFYL